MRGTAKDASSAVISVNGNIDVVQVPERLIG
jgi:hypothetical protein